MLAAGDIIALLFITLYSSDGAGVMDSYSSVWIGVVGPIVKLGTFGSSTCVIGCIGGGACCIIVPSSSCGIYSTFSGLYSSMVGGCHMPGCITPSSGGCCGLCSSPLSSYIEYSGGYID